MEIVLCCYFYFRIALFHWEKYAESKATFEAGKSIGKFVGLTWEKRNLIVVAFKKSVLLQSDVMDKEHASLAVSHVYGNANLISRFSFSTTPILQKILNLKINFNCLSHIKSKPKKCLVSGIWYSLMKHCSDTLCLFLIPNNTVLYHKPMIFSEA